MISGAPAIVTEEVCHSEQSCVNQTAEANCMYNWMLTAMWVYLLERNPSKHVSHFQHLYNEASMAVNTIRVKYVRDFTHMWVFICV